MNGIAPKPPQRALFLVASQNLDRSNPCAGTRCCGKRRRVLSSPSFGSRRMVRFQEPDE
jgi:hypothetical protein